MKLTDIVTEQQLDELDVAGGIARGLGAVAKGAGALAGVPGGMAAQYQKGKAAAKAAITGQQAPAGSAPQAPASSSGATDSYGNPLSASANPKSKAALDQITQLIGDLDPTDIPAVSSLLQKGAAKPAAAPQATASAAPGVTPTAAKATPQAAPTPAAAAAQTRATKQAAAAQTAQAQMKANPAAPKPAAPQTPDQIRAAKQAAAGQTARDQMAANPAAPKAAASTTAPTAPTVNKTAPDELGRIEPTMEPAGTAPTKPAASFNNQLAGGKQTVSTGSKFDPATMKNTPGTPVGDKVQGGVPAAGTQTTPAANTTQDGKPQWDPATGKGAKYDGVTGEPTPAWKAEQDKNAASNTPGASAFGNMASQLTKGNDANYQSTLDKNVAAEKEKLAAMQEKNPKLAGMMAQAGMDDAGNDVPAGRTQGGGKVAGQLSQTPGAVKKREKRQQAADWDRMATGTESISYGVNESRSIFTK